MFAAPRRLMAGAVIALALFTPPSPADGGTGTTVAVFTLEAKGLSLSPKAIDDLTELLGAHLGASGALSVIPTADVKARLQAQKAESFRACYDEACQIEIGKELAAELSLATRAFKVGKRCVVTAKLYDLKLAATSGSAAQTTTCDVEGLATALERVAAALTSERAPTAAKPPAASTDPNRLDAWRVQERGDYEQDGDGIRGGGGRLVWPETLEDFEIELDVQRLSPAGKGGFGVLWRGGGPEGEAPVRGYTAGIAYSGAYNVFLAVGGRWSSIATGWRKNQPYKPTPLVRPDRNHVKVVVRGHTFELQLNGQTVDVVKDESHRRGRLGINAYSGAVVRVSNVKITPLPARTR